MMSIFKVHETYQELKRYGRIVSVLVRYGFGDLLHRLNVSHVAWQRMLTKEARALESLSAPERVRLAFEELGPTFIKFGQVLSSRPDLLPTEFVKELSKLQDSVPPFPFGDAKALIEAQFGRPLTEVFASFEEEPLAAASLAQVHRARTKAGDEVAIKVQRPGIEDIIETDIRILLDLAALCERHLPESRYYEPVQIVDEFAKTIRRELDFVREGRNIERFRKFFADDETVNPKRIPLSLAGGLLMGVSAAIAMGDNVLHGLSGVPILAISSFIFMSSAFAGVWAGIRLNWLR